MPSNNKIVLVTGEVKLSFPHLFEPQAMEGTDNKKFSVAVLIPKTDTKTIQAIKTKLAEVINAQNWTPEQKKKAAIPLHDGDLEKPDLEGYPGHLYFNANTNNKPAVLDTNRNPISDATRVYPGVIARVSINLFAYDQKGKKGVGVGLRAVQIVRDGDRMGGTDASKDFDDAYSTEKPVGEDFLG